MKSTRQLLRVLSCTLAILAPVAAPRADAQDSPFAQYYFYQDALSEFAWTTECKTTKLSMHGGRTWLWNWGTSIERSNTGFVRYNVVDRCSPPAIRRWGGVVTIDNVAQLDPGLQHASVTIEADLVGADCTEVDHQFTCVELSLPFVGTTYWTGVGPITSGGSHGGQWLEGYFDFSSSYGRSRAATAYVAATIGDEIIDATTAEASLLRSRSTALHVGGGH